MNQHKPTPIRLYQLALATGLPWRWLRDEALAGRIPCLRAGRCMLFNYYAVEEALAERAAESQQQDTGGGQR